MRSFLTILYLTILSLTIQAQVNPPQLSCIEGNGAEIEIFWTPPTNPCNTVLEYTVFFSDQLGGPYQSFTISDPSVLDTTFATNFSEVYCFMQSTMNCPGQMVVSSDTLIWDLRAPTITAVSVNSSNQIEVTWEASTSPDISAYLVYTDGANIPDTVWGVGSTTYIDLNSDPSTNSHFYEIAWYRDCVNDGDRRGSIGLPYHSILLQDLDQDVCNRAFSFGWNSYENYDAGVAGYQISVKENNGSYIAVDTVPTNQLIFLYENAVNNTFYCFKIAAILPDGMLGASNVLCDTAKVIEVPIGAHVRNATVIGPNTVHIEYYPDVSGDISDLNIQRSESGNNFQTWPAANIGTTAASPSYDTYEDIAATTGSDDYYYRFRRVDECDEEHITDTVRTINLEVNLGFGLIPELEWTPFELTYGTVTEYVIIKYVNGDSTYLATVGSSQLSYEEMDRISTTSLDTICYQIIAEVDLNIPNLVSTTVFSNSNIDCLQPTPSVVAPSAFKPEGLNRVFRPILNFGTDENYIFRVHDRYGKMLFETNNRYEGWDGTYDDKLLGMEGFVYFVSFVGQDGNTYTKSGSFMLLR